MSLKHKRQSGVGVNSGAKKALDSEESNFSLRLQVKKLQLALSQR